MTQQKQLRFWALAIAGFVAMIWVLGDILLPFVLGLVIAYLLDPITDKLESRIKRRSLAALTALSATGLVILIFVALFIPIIITQIKGLIIDLPAYGTSLKAQIMPLVERIFASMSTADIERLHEAVQTQAGSLTSVAANAARNLLESGLALFDIVSLLLITPIVAFYFLRDWDRIKARVADLLPRAHAPVIRAILKDIDRTLAGFLRGQGLVCLFLGIFYVIFLTLAGLNFALLIGLAVGVLSFIPFVGTATGFIASISIALFQFDSWVRITIVLAILIIGQFIEGNFLTPRVVGDRVGLHPVWVIFAIMAGGALFGFTGVLIAVPVMAVIGVLSRFALSRYLDSPYYGHCGANDKEEGAK
ncbi:MAG: AI-2E family transporter [Pseudomonadota bacterium]|nr:AI-2E family transporter [Pseudomonadota bacterium]